MADQTTVEDAPDGVKFTGPPLVEQVKQMLSPYAGGTPPRGVLLTAKGLDVLGFQERERPGSIDDWIDMEDVAGELASNPNGARFVTEYRYATIKADVERQPLLIPIDPMHLEAEGECGVGGTDADIRCGK